MKKMLLFLFLSLAIVSCKPIKETVYIDNYITKHKIDSVFVQQYDSVYIYVRQTADTVFVTQYKYKYQYKDKIVERTDTVYKQVENTIQIPIEKPLNKWQKFIQKCGVAFLITVFLAIIYFALKFRAKIFNIRK